MGLSASDDTLITCATDGSICIWAVHDTKPLMSFQSSLDFIFISSSHLIQKINNKAQLSETLNYMQKCLVEDLDNLVKSYDVQLRDMADEHVLAEKCLEDEHIVSNCDSFSRYLTASGCYYCESICFVLCNSRTQFLLYYSEKRFCRTIKYPKLI